MSDRSRAHTVVVRALKEQYESSAGPPSRYGMAACRKSHGHPCRWVPLAAVGGPS